MNPIEARNVCISQPVHKPDIDPITMIILKRGGIVDLTRRIAEDPIGVYKTLKDRRVSGGPHFSFPEAAEVIYDLAKHLNGTPPSDKTLDEWNSLRTSFFRKLRKVLERDFPYLYTFNFIHEHLASLHYYYLKARFYEGRWSSDVSYPPDTMRECTIFFHRIMDDPSVIPFHTTKNLPPGYFAKIQSVRAYPIAASTLPETRADGRNKSPTHMEVHDMQHVEDGEKAFKNTEGQDELEKMERFQNNYLKIKKAFADLKIKSLWSACKLILFEASHERGAVKYVPADLKNRILKEDFISTIVYEIENNHFEKADSSMIEWLEPAKAQLLQIIDSGALR